MLFSFFITLNFLTYLHGLKIKDTFTKTNSGFAEKTNISIFQYSSIHSQYVHNIWNEKDFTGKEFMLLFDNGHYVHNTTTIFTTSDSGSSFEIKQILNSTFLGHFERKPDVYILFTVLKGDSKMNTTKVYLGETKDYGKSWKIQPIDLKPKHKQFDYRRDALKLHSFPGAESFMLIQDVSKNLYLSINGGKKWEKVGNQVDDFFWNEYTKTDPNEREYSFFFLQTNNAFFRAEIVRCYGSSKSDCFLPTKINLVAFNISKVHRPLVHYWPNVENSSPKSTIFYLETFKHESKPTLVSDPRDYSFNQTKFLDNKLVLYDGSTNIIKSVFLPVPKEYDVSFFVGNEFIWQAFDVLQVDDGQVFMHVSQRERMSMSIGPDIKYSASKIKRRGGILLISDSTGRVFHTSLHDHVPFADVFPIVSSRGTYITSFYQSEGSLDSITEISTVISFDRGSTWSTLNLPEGVDPKEACKRREPDEYLQAMTQILGTFGELEPLLNLGKEKEKEGEEKTCSLQLMVPFHVDRKKSGVGSFFEADEFHCMAVPSAPGLVLTVGRVGSFAHGQTRMNTYLSRNGGRSWKKVLDGKHICRILASGKLLICMPDSGGFIMRDHILMSVDHGKNWSVLPLNQTIVRNTVVTTDPVNSRGTQNEYLRQNLKLVDGGSSSFLNYTNVFFQGIHSSPDGDTYSATVFGYSMSSNIWIVITLDFKSIFRNWCKLRAIKHKNDFKVPAKKSSPFEVLLCESSSSCAGSNADYEDWTLPDLDKQSLHYNGNGCILGSKDIYRRIKESSLCRPHPSVAKRSLELSVPIREKRCQCSVYDYECAFGMVRRKELNDATSKCTLDMDAFAAMDFDKEKLEDIKYDFDMSMKKTPGNKCIGNITLQSSKDVFLHVEEVLKDKIKDLEMSEGPERIPAIGFYEILEEHAEKLGFIPRKESTSFHQTKAFVIGISLLSILALCLIIGFFVFRYRTHHGVSAPSFIRRDVLHYTKFNDESINASPLSKKEPGPSRGGGGGGGNSSKYLLDDSSFYNDE